MDPRGNIIKKRLEGVKRVIAVSGGKGGIGKSVVAAVLSLILKEKGKKVGIFDVDFCGPCAHMILGVREAYPQEEKGIVPPEVEGIKFMSINYYSKDNPAPFREKDTSSAFVEMFAITQWGSLDFLILDMPPGTKDVILDTIRFIPRVEFLILTSASQIVLKTVKKTIRLLKEESVSCVGVIENMSRPDFEVKESEITEEGVKFLGRIKFDGSLEEALGNPSKLLKTKFALSLNKIIIKNTDFISR